MPEQDDYDKLLKAYYTCFRDSVAGNLVMADLENKFYKRTFITEPFNADSIICNEGARSVVVYILSKIEELEIKNGRQR